MENTTLSICISTYNRPDDVYNKVLKILKCQSPDFDIIIQDCSSNNETNEKLNTIKDDRLIYYRKHVINHDTDSVMDCWKTVLTSADGLFALNLNDRDNINIDELTSFIHFLKCHKEMTGGVCKNVFGFSKYNSEQKAFMGVPYFSYHPSGLVFNTISLRSINNIDDIFKGKTCYIHPHDLLLAELSSLGPMFSYKRKLWSLADNTSFRNNASYLYDDNKVIDDFWFSPKNRLTEFDLFVKHMLTLKFPENIIEKKAINVSKRYLYLSTFNFAYYLEDEGQTAHYGIKRRKVKKAELIKLKNKFISNSLNVLERHGITIKKKKYTRTINSYFVFLLFVLPIWEMIKKTKE